MMDDVELRVEALRQAVVLDRLGKAPAEIVKTAEAYYKFLSASASVERGARVDAGQKMNPSHEQRIEAHTEGFGGLR